MKTSRRRQPPKGKVKGIQVGHDARGIEWQHCLPKGRHNAQLTAEEDGVTKSPDTECAAQHDGCAEFLPGSGSSRTRKMRSIGEPNKISYRPSAIRSSSVCVDDVPKHRTAVPKPELKGWVRRVPERTGTSAQSGTGEARRATRKGRVFSPLSDHHQVLAAILKGPLNSERD